MATVGYADLPVPGGGDAPTGPGDFAELASAIDPHLLQHVADQAERDQVYADAPLHTAVTAQDGSLWIKTSASTNTWATVYQPPPAWRSVTLLTGFTAGDQAPQIRRIGQRCYMRGRVEKTDGTVIYDSGGSVRIGTVPSDCIPVALASGAAGQSLVGDPVTAVGRVEVLPQNWTGSSNPPGSVVWYSQDGTGSPWVACDLDYWLD